MRKIFLKKLAFAALFASLLSFGQSKTVNASEINWWGYKLAKTAASSHTGTVDLKSGNVVMKGNQVTGGTFVMDMTTITSTDLEGDRQKKLNEHLKHGDFFETNKFPEAVYKITSVQKNKDQVYRFKINGTLTVKNQTHPVSFPANITVEKGTVTIVSDKFSFDRQKFGVSYQSSMKDVLIKNEVDMKVKVTAK